MIADLRVKIARQQTSLANFLDTLKASGSYRQRQMIKATDVEMEEYFQKMRMVVVMMAIEPLCIEDFLGKVEQRMPRWLRVLRRWRKIRPLTEQWQRYCLAVLPLLERRGPGFVVKEEPNGGTGPSGQVQAL